MSTQICCDEYETKAEDALENAENGAVDDDDDEEEEEEEEDNPALGSSLI